MQAELLRKIPGAEQVGAYDQSELVCLLTAGLYGVSIQAVLEIMPLPQVLPLPQLPEAMIGVCRYREMIIPVINLPLLLEQSHESPLAEVWQMVVINAGQRVCGLAVKDINEILSFSFQEMELMPNVETVTHESFYRGIKRMGEQVVMLLKLEEILDSFQIPERAQSDIVDQGSSQQTARLGLLRMGKQLIGISIDRIDRILRTPAVSAVTDAPSGVKGMALRPEVTAETAVAQDYYPVIDLFHYLDVADTTGKKNLILSRLAGQLVGYYAGVVEEIREINEEAISQLPSLALTSDNDFIKQVFLLGEEIGLLLDLQSVGGETLATYLQQMSQHARTDHAG